MRRRWEKDKREEIPLYFNRLKLYIPEFACGLIAGVALTLTVIVVLALRLDKKKRKKEVRKYAKNDTK